MMRMSAIYNITPRTISMKAALRSAKRSFSNAGRIACGQASNAVVKPKKGHYFGPFFFYNNRFRLLIRDRKLARVFGNTQRSSNRSDLGLPDMAVPLDSKKTGRIN